MTALIPSSPRKGDDMMNMIRALLLAPRPVKVNGTSAHQIKVKALAAGCVEKSEVEVVPDAVKSVRGERRRDLGREPDERIRATG
jgi:hypothetical protein